jgi:hypothetical protein
MKLKIYRTSGDPVKGDNIEVVTTHKEKKVNLNGYRYLLTPTKKESLKETEKRVLQYYYNYNNFSYDKETGIVSYSEEVVEYYVEINSVEDILQLAETYGNVIILQGSRTLEIYDGYRE